MQCGESSLGDELVGISYAFLSTLASNMNGSCLPSRFGEKNKTKMIKCFQKFHLCVIDVLMYFIDTKHIYCSTKIQNKIPPK